MSSHASTLEDITNSFRARACRGAVRPPTIFVADDDDLFRDLLRSALVERGCEVIEASDGAEALEKLATAADGRSAWPDALVLDVRMPSFSGLGILSVLSGLQDRPPTFLITGFADPSIDTVVARLGVVRVFRKPSNIHEVLAAIIGAACEQCLRAKP